MDFEKIDPELLRIRHVPLSDYGLAVGFFGFGSSVAFCHWKRSVPWGRGALQFLRKIRNLERLFTNTWFWPWRKKQFPFSFQRQKILLEEDDFCTKLEKKLPYGFWENWPGTFTDSTFDTFGALQFLRKFVLWNDFSRTRGFDLDYWSK